MSSSAGHKSVRKFPPPCWTRDEALVLIEAYRERWHALNRQFLRNPDWDLVAEKVTTAFPDVTPLKTAAQCRHKMEKLRQRHKIEKNRAAAFAGERFFSSWFYFEAMEAVDPSLGIVSGSGSKSEPGNVSGSGYGKLQGLGMGGTKEGKETPGLESRVRVRVPNKYPSYADPGSDQEPEDEYGSFLETSVRMKQPVMLERESVRSGLRPRKIIKIDDEEEEEDEEMWVNVPRKVNVFVRGKYNNVNNVRNSVPNVKDRSKGKKKGKSGISEVVSSLRFLGDGFMKMEKMKIDMAKDIEKMRMETELKRNELILESQKQIIETFVNGVVESRKRGSMMGNL